MGNEFYLKVGSYTGDGSDDRQITGIGFQPDLVLVKSESGRPLVARSTGMTAGYAAVLPAGITWQEDHIQSLDSDGFTVGTNTRVNNSGEVYYYIAVRETSGTSKSFDVGVYTGTGSDDRNITGVGFQPTFVAIKNNAAQDGRYRQTPQAGDDTLKWDGTNQADNIQSFISDGFQVGSDNSVNNNGVLHQYFAFKDATYLVKTGTYTGDGSDDRNITGVGFQPDVVFVKRSNYATNSEMRTSSYPAGESTSVNGALNTDRIQSFISDGFQVGTNISVNQSGNTYYYTALKQMTLYSKTLNSNSHIKQTYSNSLNSDYFIKVLGNEGSLSQNAYIKKTYSGTISSDSYILKVTSQAINSNYSIKQTYDQTIISAARIFKQYNPTIDSDYSVKRTIIPGEYAAGINTRIILHMNELTWVNNQVRDYSGRNHTMTAYNGASSTSFGQMGRAGEFSYSGSHYLKSGDTGTDFNSFQNFTLMSWVYFEGGTESYHTILSVGNYNAAVYVDGSDNKPKFYGNFLNPVEVKANSAISTSAWQHVAVTKSGTTLKIFINGVLNKTETVTGTIGNSSYVWIGYDSFGNNYWNGRLDEVVILNTAISDSEIREHYLGGISRLGVLNTDYYIKDTYSSSITSDSYIKETYPGSLVSDYYLKATGTRVITQDAYIGVTVVAASLYSDYWIRKETPKTLNSSYSVKQTYSRTRISDYWIKRTYGQISNSIYYIKVFGTSTTITQDASIIKGGQGIITQDAYIKGVPVKTINSNYRIKKTYSGAIIQNSYIEKTYSGAISQDSLIQAALGKIIQSNYLIKATSSKTISQNYYIKRTYLGTINSNAELEAPGTGSVSSNYYVMKETSESVSSDYFVKSASPETITQDAFIILRPVKNINAIYYVFKTYSQTIGQDAYISEVPTTSIPCDYYVKQTYSGVISQIAYVEAGETPASLNSDYHIAEAGNWSEEWQVNTLNRVQETITCSYYILGRNTVPEICDASYVNKPEVFDIDYVNKPIIFEGIM